MATQVAESPRRHADVIGVLGLLAPILVLPLAVLATYRPILAAEAGIIAVVVVLCVLRVDVALLLLIAASPLESAVRIGASSSLSLTKVVGAICFTSFALNAIALRRRIVFDRSHVIVLLLLALAFVSTLQADEIGPAISTSVRYLSFVALFVVVSQFLGEPALQRRVAWTLGIACALAGMQAVYNFLWLGSLNARPSYGDANDLAFILATSLPIVLWLLRERGVRRIVVVAIVAVMSAAIVLSFSRGALLGLGVAAVWHFGTERKHFKILLVAGIVAVAASYTLIQSNPTKFETGLQAKKNVAGLNVATRLDAWAVASRLAASQPILGVGPGNFRYRYPAETDRIVSTDTPLVVHNAYLDIAAELGFVGLFLFLAYLFESFARLTAAARRGYGLPGFATSVRTALVVAIVSGVFLSEQYYAPFWLLGGIASALWIEGRREATLAGG